ncbi:hypothetical protein [Dysosmobacter welbionis]|uniref:hypothetical protein n=1 Tax=Dysosmobacter welbionis TaxID=2093857 RepID=UPI002354D4DA|nr:hypothetical protein [Dysosmobacter welbionis]
MTMLTFFSSISVIIRWKAGRSKLVPPSQSRLGVMDAQPVLLHKLPQQGFPGSGTLWDGPLALILLDSLMYKKAAW